MVGTLWYLTVRTYTGTGSPEEIGLRVKQGLVPSMQQQPEFQAYFAARIDGGGGVFSESVFAGREAMLAADDRALAWTGPNLGGLLTSAPAVTIADVKVHLDSVRPGRDSYIIVRMTDGLGPASGVLPIVQERLVPLTLEQPGFRHLYTGRDEVQADRSVAVSVFSNRDTATAAHAQVVALMAQHRQVWPQPTRLVLAGEVLVSAVA